MHRIKSVGVLSVAKMAGLCYLALGLFLVPFFLLFAIIGASAAKQSGAPSFGPAVGFVLALCMPVLYGALGFVFGAIGALVYNLVAGWVGGVELELQLAAPPLPPAAANK